MIASPEEYAFAVDALKILTDKLANMRKHFDREGHTPEEIKRLTDPIICMLNSRQEEIDEWEKAHPPAVAAPAEECTDCLGIGEYIDICVHCGRNYAKERAEKAKP